jgi:ribosome-binding factor A
VSNRIVRINELIQREVSDILRRRHAAEAVAITISEVRIAPDLRDGRIFVAIIGSDEVVAERFKWLRSMAPEIREELSKRVTIKFLPKLTYVLDKSADKVLRLLTTMDEVVGREKESAEDGEILP